MIKRTEATSSTNHAVGRRKSAVARVWVKPGKGSITINDKDYKNYFETDMNRTNIVLPLQVCGLEKNVDIKVIVNGGGMTGQSDAVRLGIARALVVGNESFKPALKEQGFLRVDSRLKERKKYGQRGARRRFQFVKR